MNATKSENKYSQPYGMDKLLQVGRHEITTQGNRQVDEETYSHDLLETVEKDKY